MAFRRFTGNMLSGNDCVFEENVRSSMRTGLQIAEKTGNGVDEATVLY